MRYLILDEEDQVLHSGEDLKELKQEVAQLNGDGTTHTFTVARVTQYLEVGPPKKVAKTVVRTVSANPRAATV